MSAIRQISQHFETAPPVQPAQHRDVRPVSTDPVAEAFRRLLPLDGGLEPHLRGVLHDSLESPGSLVRAHLAFGILRGAEFPTERALAVAIAIEYFHTASLLFDDLPSMDDAKERRGRPCPHLVHGEGATILGALALINQAYALLWQVLGELSPRARQQAGDLVVQCLGERGILDGQARDLHFKDGPRDAAEVVRIAEGKTVSLVRLTLLLPAIVTGHDQVVRERLESLATVWGLSYQILDDCKDDLMSGFETGKTSHRDRALGRPNFAAVSGYAHTTERLTWLLSEGRELVNALAEGGVERWQPVLALQERLEEEAAQIHLKVRQKTSAANRSVLGPVMVETGNSPAFRFAMEQMKHRAGRGQTLVLTLPAPVVAPEALLHLDPREHAFLWAPREGAACVALGAAEELRATGALRIPDLRRTARQIGERLETVDHSGAAVTPAPRFYGGLAFRPGAADHAPWQGLGDAHFVLPRFLYRRGTQGATLSLAVRDHEMASASGREAWAVALEQRLRSLLALAPVAPMPHVTGSRIPDFAERQRWLAAVAALVDEIKAGTLLKLVIARRALVELQGTPDPVEILRHLGQNAHGATRFAVRYGVNTFLGATPERLISRRGLHVQTAALAGSSARSAGAAEALLANPKERHEHRLVADAIDHALRPLCSSLEVAAIPQVRELRHLLHLETPVRGLLRRSHHVLDLVDRLHPTPAVGGLPADEVVHHLERFETEHRGWYASPLGWFDGTGDGDFAVALRCGVLSGRQAHLYAGAGIVAESNPRLELAETELKLHTLREALEV